MDETALQSSRIPSEADNFLIEHNGKRVLHPMADPKANEKDPPLIIESGDGVHIADISGKRYLDCTASLWNVNVGYNRAEVKQAIVDQLDTLAYYNTFASTSNPPSIELSVRLTDMMTPEGMTKVFFSSGGSDANETAYKLARHYWKLTGQPEKTKIISLLNGYHGTHFGGMSATGHNMWKRPYEPMIPGFYHVQNPDIYRNPWTDNPAELGRVCAEILDREISKLNPETVAAFVAEPVQGVGGIIVPPANYWPLVREVCDKHDVLLIADEVVTGFGRTGTMFGTRTFGVKPDLMVLAKGINSGYVPLGATAISERVAAGWDTDHPLAGIMHGYTYSGHPLACAAANANLQIVVDEDLPANAAKQGEYFLRGLEDLRDRHKAIGDVRGKGLMLCIDMVTDESTRAPFPPGHSYPKGIIDICHREGLMCRLQVHRIILSPPLVFEKEHVDEALRIFDIAFSEMGSKF